MKHSPAPKWDEKPPTARLSTLHVIALYLSQLGYVITLLLFNKALFTSTNIRQDMVWVSLSAAVTLFFVISRGCFYFLHVWHEHRELRKKERDIQRKVGKKRRRINILYSGPVGSGKVTNLRYIQSKLSADQTIHGIIRFSEEGLTGQLYYLDAPPHALDQSELLMGHLPPTTEQKKEKLVCYGLHTLQEPSLYVESELAKLPQSIDGIVFVADAQEDKQLANQSELEWVQYLLQQLYIDPSSLPWVIQINKQDHHHTLSLQEVLQHLTLPPQVQVFEACALKGDGVLETLSALLRQLKEPAP